MKERYTCQCFLIGFTVGATYHFHWSEIKGEAITTNDEGANVKVIPSNLELYFKRASNK